MVSLVSVYFSQIHIKGLLLEIMPQSAITVVIIFLLLLMIVSFFISGAEVALLNLSYKDINVLKTKNNPAAKRILDLLEEPKELYAGLMIINTLSNIAIIILSNFLIDHFFDGLQGLLLLLIKIISISFFLILILEVLPKVMADRNNLRFALRSIFFVHPLSRPVNRFSKWLVGYTSNIENALGGARQSYTLEELDQAIDQTTSKDASQEEKNMLKGIVKFSNISVRQVMKSRLDVHGIEADTRFHELLKKVVELSYSRLPVFRDTLDDVIGILHTKDLIPFLDAPDDFNWHALIKPTFFVHEHKPIDDLLQEFQHKRKHMAVVVDEFGGTEGIVTLEDIIEEVIGEIRDEYDEEDSDFKKIDDHNYIFEGKILLTEVCRNMSIPETTFDVIKGESETIAGLLLEIAGEIPSAGKEYHAGDFLFTILELEKNRIKKLKVTIKPINLT